VHVDTGPRGERREHLVHVHVRAGPGAGLEDVEGELVVVIAGHHHRGCVLDGRRLVSGDHAELGVHGGGRGLDRRQGLEVSRLERRARDREVLDRALGLCTPEGLGRDADLAHRVVLDPELLVAVHGIDPTRPSGAAQSLLCCRRSEEALRSEATITCG
jgi:hypothetical protein